jgi:hypothetical protein
MKFLLLPILALGLFADSISINRGWNLIGMTKSADVEEIKNLYSYTECKENLKCLTLFKYDNNLSLWQKFENNTDIDTNEIISLDIGDGLWIYNHYELNSFEYKEIVKKETLNIYNSSKNSFEVTSNPKWYLFAQMEDRELTTLSYPINFDILYKYNSDKLNWSIYSNNFSIKSDLDRVNSGDGLWIRNSGFELSKKSYRYMRVANITNTKMNYIGLLDISAKELTTGTNLLNMDNISSSKTIYYNTKYLFDSNNSTEIFFENNATLTFDFLIDKRIDEIEMNFRVDSYIRAEYYNIYLGDSFGTEDKTMENTSSYTFAVELSSDGLVWDMVFDSRYNPTTVSKVSLKSDFTFK